MGSSAPEHHKVVVLGAGINGIALAKTYLDIDPSVDILLVDCEASIGGVWSKERIYPGLHYEVPAPLLNFTELDMCKEFGMEEWSDVTGYRVNKFLVGRILEPLTILLMNTGSICDKI
jgi:cation diffusion facilitator CzcD-associated flavoprotein CzcO